MSRHSLIPTALCFVVHTAGCSSESEPREPTDVGPDAADVSPEVATDVSDAGSDGGDVQLDADPFDPLGPGNSAPTLAGAGDRAAPVGRSTVIELEARDPDGGELEFFANGVPEGARFQKSTGVFVWIPTEDDLGRTAFILFGVRDEDGAEDSRLTTVEVVADSERTPPRLDLPDEPVDWPSGQTHLWAVPVSDPDGDEITLELEAGAPPGMTLDGMFLSWDAPASSAGQMLPVGISASDSTGLETSGELRVSVTSTPRDSLPALTASPGERLSINLVPDLDRLPDDALTCTTIGVGVGEIDGCALHWDVPASEAGTSQEVTVAIDLTVTSVSPDLLRDVTIHVSETAACSPPTVFSEEPTILAPGIAGLDSTSGTICAPEAAGTLLFDVHVPPDAELLQVLLSHDQAESTDLDLYVGCSDNDASSIGVVGEEFVSLEVTGGDVCFVDVAAYGPVRALTTYELIVLTEAGEELTCEDDALGFELVFAGDLISRTACPGADDEILLDAAVGGIRTYCDDAELDLELWATDGASTRLVDIIATDGPEEELVIDRTLLHDGEDPYVLVIPWTVPPGGAEFILEATGVAVP